MKTMVAFRFASGLRNDATSALRPTTRSSRSSKCAKRGPAPPRFGERADHHGSHPPPPVRRRARWRRCRARRAHNRISRPVTVSVQLHANLVREELATAMEVSLWCKRFEDCVVVTEFDDEHSLHQFVAWKRRLHRLEA